MTDKLQEQLDFMVEKKLLRVENGAYIDSYKVSKMIADGMTRKEIYVKLTGNKWGRK